MSSRFSIAPALLALVLLPACQKSAEPIAPPLPGASVEGDVVAFPKDSPQLLTLRTVPVVAERESRVRIIGRTGWDETRTTRVSTPLNGRVTSVEAMPGSPVKKGQILAVLSSPEFGQTQADAKRAESELQFANRSLARAKELYQAGVIPLKDLHVSENDNQRARAERERTQAKERLYGGSAAIDQQYRIVSPIDGVVVQRQVTVGQEVRSDQPGDQSLFVISNPSRLWVVLDVPEVLAGEVQIGEIVRISVAALPGEVFLAKVEYVADFIDPQTRTVRARAALDNRDRRLKAEMYITAEVEIPPSSALKVPSTSAYLLGDTYYAFVEESPGRFVRRALKANESTLGSMRISSGLAAGEKVVVDGSLLLQQLINQKATAPVKRIATEPK